MADDGRISKGLLEKISSLPEELIAEVEDFVDFIRARTQDRALQRAALTGSEASFERVWSNPEDDAYDGL